jgi:hypothetical protein
MKALTLLMLFAPTIVSFSQNTSNEVTPIEVIETITVDKSKKEIYLATRLWFYKNFNSYEGVVSVDDYENGIMYAKGILPTNYFRKGENFWKNSGVTGQLQFNLRIYFKDGIYKVIFDDLIHKGTTYSSGNLLDVGYGLLTTDPIHTAEGKLMAKTMNRNWNLLQELVPVQIADLLEGLKSTVENTSEMALD